MSTLSVKTLLESGVHFGHQTSRWNPRMKGFIFGRKNLIHIIDLKSTLRGLIRSANLVRNIAAQGKYVLFVGTKRQARSVVMEEAARSGMPYVSDRWLGGALTNFMTIRSRLARLNELEELEKTGRINIYSKKEISRYRRELAKLNRNLGGIRDMDKLPGVLIVVDPGREDIAVKEAKKLEIPVIGLVDTDTDPELVDIVIPCNDDAFRSIKVVLGYLTDALVEGKAFWEEKREIIEKQRQTEAKLLAEAARQRRVQKRDDKSKKRPGPPRKKPAAKSEKAKTEKSEVEEKKTKPEPKAEKVEKEEPAAAASEVDSGSEKT